MHAIVHRVNVCLTRKVGLLFRILVLCMPLWCHAVTITYNGVTIDWDAGLNDISPDEVTPQSFNNFYFVSSQLSAGGDNLPIRIRLPREYQQRYWFPANITLWSDAGGAAPYGIVKQVLQDDDNFGDLILEQETRVDFLRATYEAFRFAVTTYNAGDFQPITIYVHVLLSRSARNYIGNRPQNYGGPESNPYAPFEGSQCSLGFPSYAINQTTLNLVIRDTDYFLSGVGPGLISSRTWNSNPALAGIFGNGWNSQYEMSVVTNCGGARVKSGNGSVKPYAARLCPADGVFTYPIQATPPAGNFDKLTYMEGNYWILVDKPNRHTYRFDPAGSNVYRLSSIKDRNGNTLSLSYGPDGLLQYVQEASGRRLQYAYDVNRRVASIVTPEGRYLYFNYDSNGNLIQTTDLYGLNVYYQYDSMNYPTVISYAGKTIRFAYDTSGGWKHVSSVVDANGNTTIYRGYDNSSFTSSTKSNGATTTISKTNGRATWIKDPLGRELRINYNGAELASSVIDSDLNPSNYTYDDRGNLTRKTDPLGAVTSYTYDAADNLIAYANDLSETVVLDYDANHNLTSVRAPDNSITRYVYDGKGSVVGVVSPDNKTVTYTRDQFGNLLTRTDQLGKTSTYSYDVHGIDRVAAIDANGNRTSYAYDNNHRLTRITYPDNQHRDLLYDSCALIGSVNEKGEQTSYSRDGKLNVTRITDPGGNRTDMSYNAEDYLTAIVDPAQHVTGIQYNAANLANKLTGGAGGNIDLLRDLNGNIVLITDQRGGQTSYAYNRKNRLISITDQLNRVTEFTRDRLGRVTQIKNSRGNLVGKNYAPGKRLISVTHDGQPWATFAYNANGRLASATDQLGQMTQYLYSDRGELTGIQYPGGYSVAFTYDNAGRVMSMSYPGGVVVNYSRSNRNWISSINWGNGNIAIARDPAGNVVSESRSNGTVTAYEYDVSGRVAKIDHRLGGVSFARMQYSRDAAGKIVSETSLLPVEERINEVQMYASYDEANQVNIYAGKFHIYDADGNLSRIDDGSAFSGSYDAENRLLQYSSNGSTRRFAYDGLGRRISVEQDTALVRFHRDHLGRVLFETDQNNSVRTYYVYLGMRLVARRELTGESYFYHGDKLGSTVAMTDSAGVVVNAYSYDPFGQRTGAREQVANRFTFIGMLGVMDEGNGIYAMGHRYYLSSTGRFLQKDPIGYAGAANLYLYASNNPLARVDPTGLADNDMDGYPDEGGWEEVPSQRSTQRMELGEAAWEAENALIPFEYAENAYEIGEKVIIPLSGLDKFALGAKIAYACIQTAGRESKYTNAAGDIIIEMAKSLAGEGFEHYLGDRLNPFWPGLGLDIMTDHYEMGKTVSDSINDSYKNRESYQERNEWKMYR